MAETVVLGMFSYFTNVFQLANVCMAAYALRQNAYFTQEIEQATAWFESHLSEPIICTSSDEVHWRHSTNIVRTHKEHLNRNEGSRQTTLAHVTHRRLRHDRVNFEVTVKIVARTADSITQNHGGFVNTKEKPENNRKEDCFVITWKLAPYLALLFKFEEGIQGVWVTMMDMPLHWDCFIHTLFTPFTVNSFPFARDSIMLSHAKFESKRIKSVLKGGLLPPLFAS